MPVSGTRALDFDGSSGTEDNALSLFKVRQKTPVVTENLSRLTYLQTAITKYKNRSIGKYVKARESGQRQAEPR